MNRKQGITNNENEIINFFKKRCKRDTFQQLTKLHEMNNEEMKNNESKDFSFVVRSIFKYALFFGVGSAIMIWLYSSQNNAFQSQLKLEGKVAYPLYQKIIADFKSIHVAWLLLVFAAFTQSNYSRAVRWRMLMEPLGFVPKTLNCFYAVNVTYLTNLWMSRAGEFVRAGSLARIEKQSMSKVMGTVVVDRVLDLISLALIVCFAFFIEYGTLWSWLDKNMGSGDGSYRLLQSTWFIILIGFSVAALIILFILRKRILQLPLINKVAPFVQRFSDGVKSIRYVKNLPLFLFHSITIWVMYFLMTYFCFFAFPPTAHLTALAALTVFVFGTFGVLIPSPGGMGTYHFLATSALLLYNIKGDDAFSFANIMFFSIQIFYTIVVGSISGYLLNRAGKNNNLAQNRNFDSKFSPIS